MITGAHTILYSRKPEKDRAFLRDVLRMPSVDVGGGWLIFGLPPAEVAVHPSAENDVHEIYLMCADVGAFVRTMHARGIACTPPQSLGWGLLTRLTLPGGGTLGVYEPRHARPRGMTPKTTGARRAPAKSAKKARKKKASKKAARRKATTRARSSGARRRT
ncbi:MAG TPA: extradiol dioxygenase [Planctomycetota bacterium]|nr:extradiol dioxygenase [Planctomycetota bacterium]